SSSALIRWENVPSISEFISYIGKSRLETTAVGTSGACATSHSRTGSEAPYGWGIDDIVCSCSESTRAVPGRNGPRETVLRNPDVAYRLSSVSRGVSAHARQVEGQLTEHRVRPGEPFPGEDRRLVEVDARSEERRVGQRRRARSCTET